MGTLGQFPGPIVKTFLIKVLPNGVNHWTGNEKAKFPEQLKFGRKK